MIMTSRPKRLLATIVGIVGLTCAGFFAILVGVCLTAESVAGIDGTIAAAVAGFAIGSTVGSIAIFRVLQVSPRDLRPLLVFFLACGLIGCVYERVIAPEGFKLLAALLLLLAVGLMVAKRISIAQGR